MTLFDRMSNNLNGASLIELGLINKSFDVQDSHTQRHVIREGMCPGDLIFPYSEKKYKQIDCNHHFQGWQMTQTHAQTHLHTHTHTDMHTYAYAHTRTLTSTSTNTATQMNLEPWR